MKGFLKSLLVCLFYFTVLKPAGAQQVNADSSFANARTLAQKQLYSEAISVLKDLTNQFPHNTDYAIYISRVYFWSGKNAEAKNELSRVWNDAAPLKEALDLLIQLENNTGNSAEVIRLCIQGKKLFPEDVDFYTRQQAIALEKQGNNNEALQQLNTINKTAANYKPANYLKTQIYQKQKNYIAAGYLLTSSAATTDAARHTMFIEYGRKVSRLSISGRLNYSKVSQTKGVQAETDVYYKLTKRSYLYANAGVADRQSIFPNVKLGTELYYDFKKVSTSIGSRYLHFTNNTALLFTGHIAYNTGSWVLLYRPFAVNSNNKTLMSHVVNVRKEIENKESYLQLDLQHGTLPYYFITTDLFSPLNAYRAGISSKIRVKNNYFIQPAFMYDWQEQLPKQYMSRLNFQLNLSRRF